MELLFNPANLPRSMKRQEWREIDRWRRTSTKRMRKAFDSKLSAAMAFGDKHLIAQVIDEAINPPLLIGPYQE